MLAFVSVLVKGSEMNLSNQMEMQHKGVHFIVSKPRKSTKKEISDFLGRETENLTLIFVFQRMNTDMLSNSLEMQKEREEKLDLVRIIL